MKRNFAKYYLNKAQEFICINWVRNFVLYFYVSFDFIFSPEHSQISQKVSKIENKIYS